jgi:Family of unknown function (DUF6059)
MFRWTARRIAAGLRAWLWAAGRTYGDAMGMPRSHDAEPSSPSMPPGHPERLDPREPTETERRLWADLAQTSLPDD